MFFFEAIPTIPSSRGIFQGKSWSVCMRHLRFTFSLSLVAQIVCSALLGHRRQMGIEEYHHCDPQVIEGFDSHVSPNKKEYVLFDGAQLLPLFVLHLTRAKNSHLNPLQSLAPLGFDARQELLNSLKFTPKQKHAQMVSLREQMTEQARKFLPHGFGSAHGRMFVVEEIAPVDDDEEMWGDYQSLQPALSWK